jgi:hypothetical protein
MSIYIYLIFVTASLHDEISFRTGVFQPSPALYAADYIFKNPRAGCFLLRAPA